MFLFLSHAYFHLYQSRYITLMNYHPKYNFEPCRLQVLGTYGKCSNGLLLSCYVVSWYLIAASCCNELREKTTTVWGFLVTLFYLENCLLIYCYSTSKEKVNKINVSALHTIRISSRQIWHEYYKCTLPELQICKLGCDIQYGYYDPSYPQYFIPQAKSTGFHIQVWDESWNISVPAQ